MFPVLWPVVVMNVLAFAFVGVAIGSVTGWFVCRAANGGRPALLKDALLGSFGYIFAFIVCALMPWPENTVVEQLPGGGSVATTMNSYQHPHRVATVLAILFPLLLELYRWRKRKTALLS